MSEPRLISPLLNDHIMGDPISDHHGVRCCPAIRTETDEKYIVKIISIPASSRQMDALLLSGAYHTREAALNYYRELADDTCSEATLLQKLSKLEGFRCYDAFQVEPMEDGSGYDVYLISSYGNTLERFLRRSPMTHLGAVNLGLDLCAALSVSRRNGYLYVDLKPDNIFITEDKGYLIGDLGFISLRSLKYASLPDKYRSAYTAPEITDAYSALNATLDIYAAGLVLYQVFNGGQLPPAGETLVPPEYADYEMAEIILKACAEDPANRWQDPQEMGQALVSYMQRNTVNDTPIIPVTIPEPPVEAEIEEDIQEEEIILDETEEFEASAEEVEESEPEAEPPVEETVESEPEAEPPVEETGESEPEAEPSVEKTEESEPEAEPSVEETEESEPEDEPPVEETEESEPETEPSVEETEESEPEAEPPVEEAEDAEEDLEQFVIAGFLDNAFTEDDDELSELQDAAITDEVSQMLAQADALIAHKAPDPVVAPEAIEIPIPAPILPDAEEASEEPIAPIPAPVEPEQTEPIAAEQAEDPWDDPADLPPAPTRKRKFGWLIGILVLILVLLLGGLAGKHYYDNEYLQNIDAILVDGDENWLTVTLNTDIEDDLLTVYCTDTYGNKLTQSVSGGKATFRSLASGTTYKITVSISGRHRLTGQLSTVYTTAAQTSIVGFQAKAGDTDGTLILSFSVQGPDSKAWSVLYSAEGEDERSVPCTGHMAVINGLTLNKEYTFRLVPQEELYIIGGETLTFTPKAVILPQNLQILGFRSGALIATWEVPEGMEVSSWTVRCYSSNGFDATYTTTEPSIAIPGLDVAYGYTLDVKAEGMTASKWTSITPNSITFKDILLDSSTPGKLVITWPFEGTVPADGWQLKYTIDGSDPMIVPCDKNTYTLEYLFPGAHYEFGFVLPADITVFGGTAQFDVPAVTDTFTGYGVSAADMVLRLCRAPEKADWTHKDIKDADFVQDFLVGEGIGLVLYLTQEYKTSPELIEVTYILRTADGQGVSVSTATSSWTNLWFEGYCELTLPQPPAEPGSYTLDILFNGAFITLEPLTFTVQ